MWDAFTSIRLGIAIPRINHSGHIQLSGCTSKPSEKVWQNTWCTWSSSKPGVLISETCDPNPTSPELFTDPALPSDSYQTVSDHRPENLHWWQRQDATNNIYETWIANFAVPEGILIPTCSSILAPSNNICQSALLSEQQTYSTKDPFIYCCSTC